MVVGETWEASTKEGAKMAWESSTRGEAWEALTKEGVKVAWVASTKEGVKVAWVASTKGEVKVAWGASTKTRGSTSSQPVVVTPSTYDSRGVIGLPMVGTGNRSDLLFAFSGQDSYQGGDSREEQAKLNPEYLYSFQ